MQPRPSDPLVPELWYIYTSPVIAMENFSEATLLGAWVVDFLPIRELNIFWISKLPN
jgi:hypothetical protein